MTSFISNIESTSNGKKSLFTGRITTAAPQQKAAPPRTLKPKVEPLDFLRCFDLVVNLFSVPLMKRRKTRVESPKTLENRAMGHSPIGFADLSHCSPPVLPASPPRRARLARPAHALIPADPHRKAPFSPKLARSNAPLARLPLLQSAAASATIAA